MTNNDNEEHAIKCFRPKNKNKILKNESFF